MNTKLLAKSKVLEDLLSEMDESILEKIKKGDVDADVKVTKIEAIPEEPEGEIMEDESEEDFSELADIKSRYTKGEIVEEDEEEDDPEFSELKELRKKYRG